MPEGASPGLFSARMSREFISNPHGVGGPPLTVTLVEALDRGFEFA